MCPLPWQMGNTFSLRDLAPARDESGPTSLIEVLFSGHFDWLWRNRNIVSLWRLQGTLESTHLPILQRMSKPLKGFRKHIRIKSSSSKKEEESHHAPGNPPWPRRQQRIPWWIASPYLIQGLLPSVKMSGENVVWSISPINGSSLNINIQENSGADMQSILKLTDKWYILSRTILLHLIRLIKYFLYVSCIVTSCLVIFFK